MKNGHVVSTLCNGKVRYTLDSLNMVVSAAFSDVMRCVLCEKCEFDEMCSQFKHPAKKPLPQQSTPQQRANPMIPQKTPQTTQKASPTPETAQTDTENHPHSIPTSVQLIPVHAFTGMPIGDMLIVKFGKKYVEVQTKKGQIIRFNRATGLQTNCANPKFANRVNPELIPAWVPFYEPFATTAAQQTSATSPAVTK